MAVQNAEKIFLNSLNGAGDDVLQQSSIADTQQSFRTLLSRLADILAVPGVVAVGSLRQTTMPVSASSLSMTPLRSLTI